MDKPGGPTSHDVVSRVRRMLGVRAVGHTGTLDPFASGLLVLLLGRATRVARFFDGLPKTYWAVARLGVRTATDDRAGPVLGEPVDGTGVAPEAVRSAVAAMVGRQAQRPPAYSAKLVGGVRSYRRARAGQAVELPAVPVTVYRAELIAHEGDSVTFRVTVSTGTYVRALARDLGDRLGVGGHLRELRREAIGALTVEQAVPLADVGPATEIVPLTRVLDHLPALALSDADRTAVRHGRKVVGGWPEGNAGGEPVVLTAGGSVVAIARPEGGSLQPVVVLEAE